MLLRRTAGSSSSRRGTMGGLETVWAGEDVEPAAVAAGADRASGGMWLAIFGVVCNGGRRERWTYRPMFPAHVRQGRHVLPPTQNTWFGSLARTPAGVSSRCSISILMGRLQDEGLADGVDGYI
jgi:hypothetical protein